MQTAAIVFGGGIQSNNISASPLMVENVKSEHAAVSSLDCPPFIAHELCRERLVMDHLNNVIPKNIDITKFIPSFFQMPFPISLHILWEALELFHVRMGVLADICLT